MQYPKDEEIRAAFQGALNSEHGLAQAHGIVTQRLSDSLDRHAGALKEAAKASDRYAGRLVWATWALVLSTVVLVYATFQLD